MKLYESTVWLHKRYVVERKNIKEMAEEAQVSHMTIQRALEKHKMIRNQRSWKK
jgi:DNA-binding phage protein